MKEGKEWREAKISCPCITWCSLYYSQPQLMLPHLYISQSETKGDLLLSLNYVPDRGVIQGMVLKATNLRKQDIIGLAGMLCVL